MGQCFAQRLLERGLHAAVDKLGSSMGADALTSVRSSLFFHGQPLHALAFTQFNNV